MYSWVENNHLAVRPLDKELYAMFAPLLKDSPFSSSQPVTEDTVHCSILYTTTPMLITPDPTRVYSAIITGANVWLDQYKDIKDLVVTLESSDLVARRAEVLAQTNLTPIYSVYEPHITLAYDIPNSRKHYRWFVNEVIDKFNGLYKGKVIRFSNEYLESSAGKLGVTSEEPIALRADV